MMTTTDVYTFRDYLNAVDEHQNVILAALVEGGQNVFDVVLDVRPHLVLPLDLQSHGLAIALDRNGVIVFILGDLERPTTGEQSQRRDTGKALQHVPSDRERHETRIEANRQNIFQLGFQ